MGGAEEGWEVLEVALPPRPPEEGDVQKQERRRRQAAGAGARHHRRRIQDLVSFLGREAASLGCALTWHSRLQGGQQEVRVALEEEVAEGRGRTAKQAREAAAKALLRKVGPWVEEEVWAGHTATLAAALPPSALPWLPPVWDARHLEVPGEQGVLYEVECQLGPLSCLLAAAKLSEAVAQVAGGLARLVAARDLPALAALPTDERVGEMEVEGRPYTSGPGVLAVRMTGAYCLPPLDLGLVQARVGRLPPSYTARDQWGCVRVFTCLACPAALTTVEELEEHVASLAHWRRLGRLYVSGQIRETFLAEGGGEQEEEGPVVAGPRHPRQDEEAGVEVDRESVSYLLAVYSSLPPSGDALPFAPPPAPEQEQDYASLYGGGSSVRMGWGPEGEAAAYTEYAGNPLGNPFTPVGGGGHLAHPMGRGYGWGGPPRARGGRGRGRGGQGRAPRPGHDPGEVVMPSEGEGGNTAYTGLIGKRGTVSKTT